MKILITLLLATFVLLIAIYYAYFYITPSVSIINTSAKVWHQVKVELPNSTLNFGELQPNQENTIHYQLAQTQGRYHYHFSQTDGQKITGSCDVIANNEYHKRVIIYINGDLTVSCTR